MNTSPTLTQPLASDPDRLKDPKNAMAFVNMLLQADDVRSKQRAKVKGLVDGNAPYPPGELRKEGQAFRCNVNFREAESHLATALSAFYDLSSEASTYATVTCDTGNEKDTEWGRAITDAFDIVQKEDCDFDYTLQISQYEMSMFGTGPMFFDNPLDWRCIPLKSGQVLVPDGTKSNVSSWDACVIRIPYQVGQLYDIIENEQAAKSAGWDVEAVKDALLNAHPEKQNQVGNWEWFQQQIRNNDIWVSARCNVVKCAHILFKEKRSGKISHCIINETNAYKYLFQKFGKFDSWGQAMAPMYYDKGDGQHHSVKGMGVKMYPIIEIKNRLKCQFVDSAFFRSSMFIQPQTAGDISKLAIVPRGPYSILPPNVSVPNVQASGSIQEPLLVDRDMDNLLAGNLSQYRQRIEKPGGNPRTATEIEAIMSQQSTLGKTQLSRYYVQLDAVYAERFRRICDKKSIGDGESGRLAKRFHDLLKRAGVPSSVLKDCTAKATRVVGQGSQYVRSATLKEMIPFAGSFPPAGQEAFTSDLVASMVGQSMSKRYLPKNSTSATEEDQAALATMELADLKAGIMPLVTGTQDHIIHAKIHISNGSQAVNAVQTDPNSLNEVALTLQLIVQHSAEHLQRASNDIIRQHDVQVLGQQLNQLAKIAQDLINQAGQGQGQESEDAQPSDNDGDEQDAAMEREMKMRAFQQDMQLKKAAAEQDMATKAQHAKQQLAIADAKGALHVTQAATKMQIEKAKAEQQAKLAKKKQAAAPKKK